MSNYGTRKSKFGGHGGTSNGPESPDVLRPATAHIFEPITASAEEPEFVDEMLRQSALGYKAAAREESTRQAYARDWTHFSAWCADGGYQALPADVQTVDFYLVDHAGILKVSTLERRLVGISLRHKAAGYESPTTAIAVRETLQGMRRIAAKDGTGAPRQAAPLLTEDVRQLVDVLDLSTLQGLRDRAMLLVAFAAALRAGEIGSIHLVHLRETRNGYMLTLPRSKTDQAGEGIPIGVPHSSEDRGTTGSCSKYCPVGAIKAWIAAADIKQGVLIPHLDRHGNVGVAGVTRRGVNYIIRRAAAAAGMDATLFSGHSLRSGLATSAALNNAAYSKIQAQGRWKTGKMVDRYIRDAELFKNNAATSAGI